MKSRPPKARPGTRPSQRRTHPSTISIDVADHQRLLKIPTKKLTQLCRYILDAEGVTRADIELALVNDPTMRELHRRYFNLDTPTDVLSFPLGEPGEPLVGQIVLSVETALRQANRLKTPPSDEVLLYVVHGLLHLCGYDDQSAADARRMRRRQGKLLKSFAVE